MKNIFNIPAVLLSALFLNVLLQSNVYAITLEKKVISDNDDATEYADHQMNKQGVNKLVRQHNTTVGLRFTNLSIPENATITNAYIRFTAKDNQNSDADFIISAESHSNPPAFTNNDSDITDRTKTNTTVSWSPNSWVADSTYQTPNISSIIQTVIDDSGSWESGNAMVLLISKDNGGTDRRVAHSYESDAAKAPLLHVEYTVPDDAVCNAISAFSVRYIETDQSWEWIERHPADANQSLSIPDSENQQISASLEDGFIVFTINGINSSHHTAFLIDADNDMSTGYGDMGAEYRIMNNNLEGYGGADGEWEWQKFDSIDHIERETNLHSTIITVPLTHLPILQGKCSTEISQSVTTQVDFGVASENDDAEEDSNGYLSLSSSDLEMTEDDSTQTIGIRFNSVTIPKNITITNAYIQFHVDDDDDGETNLIIRGQAHDNAIEFTYDDNDISSRSTTASSINWSPEPWEDVGDEKNTPDLKNIVQEVIGRNGWSTGNSIVFIITGTGKRVADSYDGDTSGKPRLFIEYIESDPQTPPPSGDAECTAIFEDDFESGLSSRWRTLKALGGFTPALQTVSGGQRLRLTNREHDLSTAVTLDYVFSSQNNEFVMEFDYYAYGGCSDSENYKASDWGGATDAGNWGADGLSIILFDSAVGRSPRVGASGGSLGYANGNIVLTDGSRESQDGFEGGWFGIGLDEFGNFKTSDEGRRRIDGVTDDIDDINTEEPNTVAIRGSAVPANGSDTGYRLLASTDALNPPLARLIEGSGSYKSGRYRLTVNMTLSNVQMVKLERKTGSEYVTIIDEFNAIDIFNNQGDTPEEFRVAFSSGTGGACNNHEIDNVKICGLGEEYTSSDAVCWATTDDASTIYQISPKPGETPIPESTAVTTSRVLTAEGGAFRPSDRYVYKFDDDGESYNHESDQGPDSLYRVNTDTGYVSLVYAALVPNHVDAAEFYYNAETQEEIFYVIEEERILHAFNPSTWQELDGYPKTISGNISLSGLAINSHTGEAYAMDDYNWDDEPPKLYSFNLLTAEATYLLTLQEAIDAEGLAFADDGSLYVENEYVGDNIDYMNTIFKINTSDGSLEPAAKLNNLYGDIETFSCNGGSALVEPPTNPPVKPLYDYGDAPESYYPAFHIIAAEPTIYLGSVAPDHEVVQDNVEFPYGAGATGDDIETDGKIDDEEGVLYNNVDLQGQSFTAAQTYTLTVNTHGAGYLNAWIDWNADGRFQSSEKISEAEDGSAGIINLSITVPANAVQGSTYARFRYSSHQNLLPAGPANDGEAEDYTITITEGISVCSIDDVTSGIYSTAAVAVNMDRLNTETRLFQTQFNSATWEGHLLAYDLVTNNTDGNTKSQRWNAADQFPDYSQRNIFSYNPQANNNRGIAFAWTSLNDAQKALLRVAEPTNNAGEESSVGCSDLPDWAGSTTYLVGDEVKQNGIRYESVREASWKDPSDPNHNIANVTWGWWQTIGSCGDAVETNTADSGELVDASVAQSRMQWLRGQKSNEKTEANASGLFRPRSKLLGDIIHSSPVFAGRREDYGYSSLSSGGSSYPAFLTAKRTKQEVVYVGANDGMLHAFNANTGAELFGYIPNEVISNLSKLTSINYGCQDNNACLPHEYFVDGTSTTGDAYFDNAWHTVLLGTLGKGGKGIFALDVTDPTSFVAGDVMWELSTTQAANSASVFANHLGYSIPVASIVHLANGSWAAVVSNGYESASGKAVLFLIDISNGHLIKAINTGVGSADTPNGLSTPIAVDTNGDRITDVIYAGDLLGNMWKFDLSSSSTSNWDVAYKDGSDVAQPLFTTCETSDCTKNQAITAKPQVGHHPSGGYMIYFGTGQYFDVDDNVKVSSPDIHTLYGIHDNGAVVTGLDSLTAQTILQESTVRTDFSARITSNNTVDFSNKKGWYMKLLAPNNTRQGERIISQALLRRGRLIVTTAIPPENSCQWGGSSWIMDINAISGGSLDTPPLDINDDKKFTDADKIDYQSNPKIVSGVRQPSLGLVLSSPEIISHTTHVEGKYVNGTSGAIGMFRESTSRSSGRQAWRQIR